MKIELLQDLRKASLELRRLSTEKKNLVLSALRTKLLANQTQLLKANSLDVEAFKKSPQYSQVLLERLILSESRLADMLASLEAVGKKRIQSDRLSLSKK